MEIIVTGISLVITAGLMIAVQRLWHSLSNSKTRFGERDTAVTVLQARLLNERNEHTKIYMELVDTQEQLELKTKAERSGAHRVHRANKDLELMTEQRDELLARVIFDETELETVFEDIEDAEAFLAKRKRAMEGIRRVTEKLDFSDPRFDDVDLDDTRYFEGEEEVFPHCSAADTTKARDELMQGFDDIREAKSIIDSEEGNMPNDVPGQSIPWFGHTTPTDGPGEQERL
ncbi:MAG: hypothetical protein V3S25_11540 [Nitrospirales bacterium]